MKNQLLNLGKRLSKEEQKKVSGGMPRLKPFGPCGETGGMIVANHHCAYDNYGTVLVNGVCWACY
ncbi:hypothetical protein [Aquimarina sp. 2201CG14-23]|uniref:hypothetical protein n=1 Tax=Aquimarina mycalae TaxID=3040073 RepID=UPI002477E6FB|nr:hypothetical protein [Aquimarina sp. 2201CG14-23]MDH7448200.1 hypothetical protein [Aquimarina sp. 2201CG14-23]